MGTVKHTYPHALESVFAKLTDAAHLRRRSEAGRHRDVDVRIDVRGDDVSIRLARDIESDIPSFAKKVVDAVNHVVDAIEWHARGDRRVGSYHVTVSKRIGVRGEMTLVPVSGGCEYTDTFTATVDVPLVGGKIAQLVEKETAAAIRADCAFTDAELSRE